MKNYQTSIAVAVKQQSATVQEASDNAAAASQMTTSVLDTIDNVSTAMNQTRQDITDANDTAAQLKQMAERLGHLVQEQEVSENEQCRK